jgi:hypothetical protein
VALDVVEVGQRHRERPSELDVEQVRPARWANPPDDGVSGHGLNESGAPVDLLDVLVTRRHRLVSALQPSQ